MNKDQTTGIIERVIYGVLLGFFMNGVKRGWYDAEMAGYLAGGVVAFVGGAYAWWINRPAALMNAATNQIPDNARLVIETKRNAPADDKDAACALAEAANEKVVAKTS